MTSSSVVLGASSPALDVVRSGSDRAVDVKVPVVAPSASTSTTLLGSELTFRLAIVLFGEVVRDDGTSTKGSDP